MSSNRLALLEQYGRVYGDLGLAIAFTRTNDPRQGDPKACGSAWDKTSPLADADYGAGLLKGRGQQRNPVVVLRPSNLIALECDTEEKLAQIEALGLPETVTVRSSAPYKRHFWFRPPNGHAPEFVAFRFEEAGITGDRGRYLLVPPAVHPSGAVYEFIRSPEDTEIAVMPKNAYAQLMAAAKKDARKLRDDLRTNPDAKIPEGKRRETIFRFACSQQSWGVPPETILEAAQALNRERCVPALSEAQVETQVRGALQYEPGTTLPVAEPARSHTTSATSTLEEVVATFSRWLYLPDHGPLLAVLGAVAANRLDGDPVWLLLVGPPGSGKSELLSALFTTPDVHPAATLTEAALLSGSPKREHATGAKGGLLRAIGEFGIIVAKDFGSVLSMNRDARAAVLAALREVYDGSWTRHVGTDGGKTLAWAGKVGLVAGCTPTIDRHHAVMGAMGERFVLYRLPYVGTGEQAHRALLHAGREKAMRAELSSVVAGLYAGGLRKPRALDADEREQLIALSTLTVVCRSAVERDGYSREIELIPDPEAPTRLVIVLDRLLAGLDAIGVERSEAWRVVRKAALDSIPATRLSVLQALAATGALTETTAVAEELGYPTGTTRRVLEDLTAHGVVSRVKSAEGEKNVDRWELTEWATNHYRVCVPEMSSNTRSGRNRGDASLLTFREREDEGDAPAEGQPR